MTSVKKKKINERKKEIACNTTLWSTCCLPGGREAEGAALTAAVRKQREMTHHKTVWHPISLAWEKIKPQNPNSTIAFTSW